MVMANYKAAYTIVDEAEQKFKDIDKNLDDLNRSVGYIKAERRELKTRVFELEAKAEEIGFQMKQLYKLMRVFAGIAGAVLIGLSVLLVLRYLR